MIAEPFIQTRSLDRNSIIIEWFDANRRMENPEIWQPYADFEREKLKALWVKWKAVEPRVDSTGDGYRIGGYCSAELTGYTCKAYDLDTEAGRLIARAAFLRFVCEKEGVEWLPKQKCGDCCYGKLSVGECSCSCHKPKDKPAPCGCTGMEINARDCKCQRAKPAKVEINECEQPMNLDYYTKEEIDERLDWLVDTIGELNPDQRDKLLRQFQDRFLS